MEGIARIARYYLLSPRSLWDQWSRHISTAIYADKVHCVVCMVCSVLPPYGKVQMYGTAPPQQCDSVYKCPILSSLLLCHTHGPTQSFTSLSSFDIHMHTEVLFPFVVFVMEQQIQLSWGKLIMTIKTWTPFWASSVFNEKNIQPRETNCWLGIGNYGNINLYESWRNIRRKKLPFVPSNLFPCLYPIIWQSL